jgi:hypothetical protein
MAKTTGRSQKHDARQARKAARPAKERGGRLQNSDLEVPGNLSRRGLEILFLRALESSHSRRRKKHHESERGGFKPVEARTQDPSRPITEKTRRRLAEKFADAADSYRRYQTAADAERASLRDQVRRQVDAAGDIEKKAIALLNALERRRETIRAAVADGHLPEYHTPRVLADLARAETSARAASRPDTAVFRLVKEVWEWKKLAQMKAPDRGGWRVGLRPTLPSWVGYWLADAGVALTTTRTGTWARVLTVLYQAARIPGEPAPFRDLNTALASLNKEYPKLVPRSSTHAFANGRARV